MEKAVLKKKAKNGSNTKKIMGIKSKRNGKHFDNIHLYRRKMPSADSISFITGTFSGTFSRDVSFVIFQCCVFFRFVFFSLSYRCALIFIQLLAFDAINGDTKSFFFFAFFFFRRLICLVARLLSATNKCFVVSAHLAK